MMTKIMPQMNSWYPTKSALSTTPPLPMRMGIQYIPYTVRLNNTASVHGQRVTNPTPTSTITSTYE